MLRLINLIQNALGVIWDRRFSELLRRSREAAQEGLTPEQAYRRAYADGYWDGTTDLTSVLRESEFAMLHMAHHHATQPLPSWRPLVEGC